MSGENNRGGRGGLDHSKPLEGYGGHASHSQIHQPPTKYSLGEKLGPETRQREYKAAQGRFMKYQLRETVAKYVCGFLNSQVEGKLMLGVSDKGEVLGVDNSMEDRDRNKIDSAIKALKPPVIPQDYILEYCYVLDKYGYLIDDKTVIELTVFAKNDLSVLYETNKGECWIRRDASTEKMTPQQIQEWARQKHFREIDEMKKTEVTMKEQLEKNDFLIRRQADTIMEQKSELDKQKKTVVARTCNIL